jgi:hypothetical protein
MRARPKIAHRLLGLALAVSALFVLTGCSLPPALSKAELDSGKLSDKHPKLSAEKQKAGCRSCHREQAAVSK